MRAAERAVRPVPSGRNSPGYAVRTTSCGGARYSGKSGSLVRSEGGRDHTRIFRFMTANQAVFPIATMARVIGVSRAGYHAGLRRPPSA
ncbi:protein of unknown function (plasmid) [Rhodovastum atsumiense]|nr:protein of unknown function [Rhodovastum atsumiense]